MKSIAEAKRARITAQEESALSGDLVASIEFGYEHRVLDLLWSCERFVSRRVQWVYVRRGRLMEVTDYAFFPTRVVTIQFPDTGSLNADLCDLLERRPELDDRYNMHPDALNLLRLADTVPAIEQLRSMFIKGVKHWLETEGIAEPDMIDLLLFSNRMGRGESTIVHNHNTDLIGIYYARTADSNRKPICAADGEDYFEAGDGVLVLHDPRFNANLTSVCNRDHIKVFPRPGLMLIFPAYVWHSVTPHLGEFHRLSFAMNFTLRWPAGSEEQHSLK